MKRRQFLQSTTACGAGMTMSLSASALNQLVAAPADGFPELSTFAFESVTADRRGRVIAQQTHEARYFTEMLNESERLDMIAIDGSQAMVGTTDAGCGTGTYEYAPQCINVEPLYLGRTAVTQDQWRAVAALPSVSRELALEPACFTGGDHPVECVSWHDAQEFCDRLSVNSGREYRLPTEAEWEAACRAGTTSAFHVGATVTSELANYSALHVYDTEQRGAYPRRTIPVAQFAPNAHGLYDMHGNVWEWCADAWQDSFRDRGAKASDDYNGRRALRGGSWADAPMKLRSASRTGYAADSLNRIIGFRIALSLRPGRQA
ncbi:MAG: sulfatase activating formylglycine-generating enzyme [Gammaproteobacteria bacterium]|jgi:formylglycine-generating enzyme required for sulfatase activity